VFRGPNAEPARVRPRRRAGGRAACTAGRGRPGGSAPPCRPEDCLYQCPQRRGGLLCRADRARWTMSAPAIADEEAWAAVVRRDRAYDGRFVTGVLSTGIYCRPSCAARHPARANVRFFAGGAEAREAGLRPCLRCLPDDVARDEQAVLRAIKAIKAAEMPLPLAQLANSAGYSPSHFQRVFSRLTGLSPAAYARALREERAREALTDGESVTGAIYDAGFESASRFYDSMQGRLGMSPSAWVKGGAGVTIRWAVVESSLGPMLVAATEKGVCRLSFGRGRDELERLFPKAELVEGGEDFAALLQRVIAAVEDPATGRDIPVDVRGTA